MRGFAVCRQSDLAKCGLVLFNTTTQAMLAHLHSDLPGATSFRRSMVLQIWERVGDQIIPVELQSDSGDYQYDITHHQNNDPIVTHKITTTCEVVGVRTCASCTAILRSTMMRCVDCGSITIN
eukprot:9873016-Karenia_brevis.AAC.1